jgi:hypothetical protein
MMNYIDHFDHLNDILSLHLACAPHLDNHQLTTRAHRFQAILKNILIKCLLHFRIHFIQDFITLDRGILCKIMKFIILQEINLILFSII